jgi:hypothetical protein
VPFNTTVKAAARTRRRSPAHIFTGSSWATWYLNCNENCIPVEQGIR